MLWKLFFQPYGGVLNSIIFTVSHKATFMTL